VHVGGERDAGEGEHGFHGGGVGVVEHGGGVPDGAEPDAAEDGVPVGVFGVQLVVGRDVLAAGEGRAVFGGVVVVVVGLGRWGGEDWCGEGEEEGEGEIEFGVGHGVEVVVSGNWYLGGECGRWWLECVKGLSCVLWTTDKLLGVLSAIYLACRHRTIVTPFHETIRR
jgi:hypothetical protein